MADHLRLSADERTDLVAFLDRELPEDRARSLEAKLTRSVSGRREIESLKSTWELLDLLPRPQVDEHFTDRTITLAVNEPDGEASLITAARGAIRRGLAVLMLVGVVAVSGLIGYAGARWAWPDPTARLARDLTIAEHLEDYQAAGSLEFLRRLDESTVFKEASD